MLPRKTSILLNTLVITFLVAGSHTTLAKVSDAWENRNTQATEAQSAADKAKEERYAEMKKAISEKNKDQSVPETKPTNVVKPETASPEAPMAKPTPKARTLQEQIALNKQKKADELKAQEANKAAGGTAKSMTWQERARLARQKREAAMKVAEPDKKEGVEAHTKPPVMQEPIKSEEPKAVEHEHIVTTLPMPEKMASKEAQKPSAIPEKEPGDEPMKIATNRPAPPKGGPKPPSMGLFQKKMMEKQEAADSSAAKPKLSFLEELKQKRAEIPPAAE